MPRFPVRAAGLLLAVAMSATACSSSSGAASFAGQVVDPPFQISSAKLTDTENQPYSLAKTSAPLTLVFFGYTHCPDICGLVMGNLASAITRLDADDAKRVQVVFVTTDPSRDTTSALRTYLDHLDPDFEGLTGNLDTIAAIGKSVAVGVTDGVKLATGGYDLNTHSTQVTGILPGGEAPVYWHQETSAAQYAADIHTILDDGGVPAS